MAQVPQPTLPQHYYRKRNVNASSLIEEHCVSKIVAKKILDLVNMYVYNSRRRLLPKWKYIDFHACTECSFDISNVFERYSKIHDIIS
uniref:Uncharacterized protein n=1 Tax=Hyaloperonospora arabidopsidis (strain Emoy2) TaxID=559515 RepID=M4BNC4_HYAAE